MSPQLASVCLAALALSLGLAGVFAPESLGSPPPHRLVSGVGALALLALLLRPGEAPRRTPRRRVLEPSSESRG